MDKLIRYDSNANVYSNRIRIFNDNVIYSKKKKKIYTKTKVVKSKKTNVVLKLLKISKIKSHN